MGRFCYILVLRDRSCLVMATVTFQGILDNSCFLVCCICCIINSVSFVWSWRQEISPIVWFLLTTSTLAISPTFQCLFSLFFLCLRFICTYFCRFASSLILPSASFCYPPSLLLLCLFPPPLLLIAFSSFLSFSVFLHCYIFFIYLCSSPSPALSPLHPHLNIIVQFFTSSFFCVFVLRPLLLLHVSNFLFIYLDWTLFYVNLFIAFSQSSLSFFIWC